jgi:hypothetical protein
MSGRSTREQWALVSIVVVDGPATLIEAVRRAAGAVSRSARVVRADIASAATDVARERPFAILISDQLYAFDADEFEALARDVRATLLPLPTAGVPMQVLYARLMPLLKDAFREYSRKQ